MRPKDVDRTPLTEFGERHLDGRLPSSPREYGKYALDQRGMTLVEQTVGGGTVPPNSKARTRLAPATSRTRLMRSKRISPARPDSIRMTSALGT